ncbi:aldehyde dehydrogenase family protein [Mycobacterium sp. 21AC1]|uniref:aldehyde dehydrogenase family protein n=1 Tax=[Mycobacterium] appelbergii TaxID=2939269 RepID=UPI0029393DAF|nr:aldehyde dehydrogenase family protein [Mycobacterium sp. 21AC1]MDV3125470.1 aldehyde dehydrogenase family protein [Mycobacterium sp. 21AC1]
MTSELTYVSTESVVQEQQLYVNGRWVKAETSMEVTSPWDDSVIGRIAAATADQVSTAIGSAKAAQNRGLAPHQRAVVLRTTAALLHERSEQFAQSISREAGKPIQLARIEVARGAEVFDYAADEARSLPAEAVPVDGSAAGAGHVAFTIAQPLGVIAAITPFNFPLNTVAHKVAPAIAAGCPVVLKPSEKTPFTAGLLAELMTEAGLPGGFLNVVTGEPSTVVDVLANDDRVVAITFTGSSRVGWQLKQSSPKKHHTMELGSSTAMYIAADADIPAAVAAAAKSAFGFAGQVCLSLQRLYVERPIFDAVVDGLARAADAMIAGDPSEEATEIGPLITAAATDRLLGWIENAQHTGAAVRAGGVTVGPVLRPTVVTGVAAEDQLVCSEVFGPIVSVLPVDGVEQALEHINAVPYGLNASVFTSNVATAMRFSRAVESGQAIVNDAPNFRTENMPYGGVKDSGQGREGIPYAVREFTHHKLVVLAG